MGTTGFVARTLGAADHAAMERLILRVLLLALVFGLLVLVLGRPVVTLALWLIEGTAEVERLARTYAHIRLWSAPATLCIYVCTGVFIGLKNTRYVLTLQLVLNLTNVLLDLIFVPWLGFGVEGVAWATLIAEYLAAGLGLWMLRPWLRRALDRPDWGAVLAPGPMAELMKSNGHLLVRTRCLVFAFSWFTAQSATLGELVLAANSILLHLQTFMAYGLDGFAHAAESLFSDQAPVLEVAGKYLPWMILSPLVSVWSYQLDGIFIGSGNTREMQNAMALSTAIFVALTWMLLPWLGNHGLFLALTLFMGVRALTLLPYYRRALPAKA